VNSGGANLASIIFALQRLNISAKLTTDREKIINASHVILPGVGTAAYAMNRLNELKLCETLCTLTQPVLGICLGMQLLYESSAESAADTGGDVKCLGVIPGKANRLLPSPQTNITIPHMGWNTLEIINDSPLLQGISNRSYVYFVHSYAVPITPTTSAAAQHGVKFTAICQWHNFYGTQFHPERSGKIGATILKNFLSIP